MLRCRKGLTAAGLLLSGAVAWLFAHEGHAPLPSRGATVDLAKGRLTLAKAAREALDVQTEAVVLRPLAATIAAPVTLTPAWRKHAFATSRLPGRIARLLVQPGQTVTAGQALAEVESGELEALQTEVLNARAQVRLSAQVMEELRAAGTAIPPQELLDAENRQQQNQVALDVACARWLGLGLEQGMLQRLLTDAKGPLTLALPIRSPIAGTVIHADLSVGRGVEAAEHLFEIVDPRTVAARIDVPARDLPRVAIGQKVELRLTAYPGEVFVGVVQLKGLALDGRTHLNAVWAELTNLAGKEPRLLPGMTGQAQLMLPEAENALTLPAAAVLSDGLNRFVFVEQSQAARASDYRKVDIAVLHETPAVVQVEASAILPGDRVLTRGAAELAEFFRPGVLRVSPATARCIRLRVEPAKLEAIDDVVALDGVVEVPPDRRTFASARLAGTVQALTIERGQEVKAGQVMAEIASAEFLNLQLDLLREDLSTRLLDQQLDRVRAAGGSLPRRRLLELEANRAANALRRDGLRRRLELLGLSAGQLDELLKQKAPVATLPVRGARAGRVVRCDKVLGEAVRAEEALVEIHDLERPWVRALVPEADFARVQVGQTARVSIAGMSEILLGKVVRSGRFFENDTGALAVWIELDQTAKDILRHGQLARVSLSAGRATSNLAVPLAAVVREGQRAFLFVQKDDGSFDRRPVTTGHADDRHVEISSGLQPGERVAVSGVEALRTGFASLR